MQLHQVKLKVEEMLEDEARQLADGGDVERIKVQAHVLNRESVNGWILKIEFNGVFFTISSQREKYRVFKSLDTLQQLLSEANVPSIIIYN